MKKLLLDTAIESFNIGVTSQAGLFEENAKLKEELAELKNLCTKEQLAELEYIQKRKGGK